MLGISVAIVEPVIHSIYCSGELTHRFLKVDNVKWDLVVRCDRNIHDDVPERERRCLVIQLRQTVCNIIRWSPRRGHLVWGTSLLVLWAIICEETSSYVMLRIVPPLFCEAATLPIGCAYRCVHSRQRQMPSIRIPFRLKCIRCSLLPACSIVQVHFPPRLADSRL